MEAELKRRLDNLDSRQLSFSSTLERIEREQHAARNDVRELRQTVGLSFPPSAASGGKSETVVQRAAAWHLRASLRYAAVAGAGALGTLLVDWLARILGG